MNLPANVLVVDDDLGTCETLGDVLRVKGYTVQTANRGGEGLGVLRIGPVDVAIVDVKLPDVSGLELLGAIKDVSPRTEVIFVTGYASVGTAIQAINGAAFAYLTKPFEIEHLLATVKKALEKQDLHDRIRQQAEELEQRVEDRTRELNEANAQLQHEIAERRRAEAEAARANRAKSEFLSRMSHELRTPLNAILGFGQLLEMERADPRQRESTEQILRAGRHLLSLIDEVLDIARIEAGGLRLSLEPVPLPETIRGVTELMSTLARDRRIDLRVDNVPAGLHVMADRQRLQQVLLNLLSNGVKYTPPGGAVTVSCAMLSATRVQVRVTDTGVGIAPDKVERLFTPFDRLGAETGEVEGTGLGLTLSKHLVEAMGGVLRVDGGAGVGSTFSVDLSLAEAAVQALPRPWPAAAATRTSEATAVVLYIEDNLSNLRLVERILERRPGIKVISAMQGGVGIDLAREHRPDLILLDQHLPDIQGAAVIRVLKADARTSEIPVVILSADARPRHVAHLREAGVLDYLTKPLDVSQLLALVDEILAGREGT